MLSNHRAAQGPQSGGSAILQVPSEFESVAAHVNRSSRSIKRPERTKRQFDARALTVDRQLKAHISNSGGLPHIAGSGQGACHWKSCMADETSEGLGLWLAAGPASARLTSTCAVQPLLRSKAKSSERCGFISPV